jgi:hypothetical protein
MMQNLNERTKKPKESKFKKKKKKKICRWRRRWWAEADGVGIIWWVDVIPQNLYPRINVILISRVRRICNFIGKYRLNVKDGRN